jgi:rubrerythrin
MSKSTSKKKKSKKNQHTNSRPSYLGLLNAIANGEGQAYTYLTEWADCTDNKEVRATLKFVALREGEHALAFEKRIVELGHELRRDDGERAAEALGIVRSNLSDKQKFKALGLVGSGTSDGPDVFSRMFENKDLDPVTGGLLGRYIAEERDSGRRLRACYKSLA